MKLLRLKRIFMSTRRQFYLVNLSRLVLLFTLTGCLILLSSRYIEIGKPYYLIDNPTYVFINNDDVRHHQTARQTCNPYNKDDEAKNVRVRIDGEYYPKVIPLNQNRLYNFSCLNSSSYQPTILLWNRFKGMPINDIDDGPLRSLNCPVTNCIVTKDRSKLNESAYVLFHMRANIDEFPLVRFSRQKWVYVVYESQQNCPMCTRLEGFFNLSSTYSDDSGITSVYYGESGLSWSNEEEKLEPDRFSLESRPGFAAALISDCSDHVRRIEYIRELGKHAPVDLFGSCSGRKCPHDDKGGDSCRAWISSNYKFFMAFENSVCNGYITEKLFATLRYDILPVVLGGGDYTRYIPKSGFISVLDYPNPADLAAYLFYLASNQTAYSAYFAWKRYLRVDHPTPAPQHSYLCEMCIKLQFELHTAQNGVERTSFIGHSKHMGMKENCRGVQVEKTRNGDKLFKYYKGQYLNMHFY